MQSKIYNIPKEDLRAIAKLASLMVIGIEKNKTLTERVFSVIYHVSAEHVGICRAVIIRLGTQEEKQLNQYAIPQAELFMVVADQIIDPNKSKMLQYSNLLDDMQNELRDCMEKVMSVEKMPTMYKYYKKMVEMIAEVFKRSPV